MANNKYIKVIEETLEKLKGFSRIYFLTKEKERLDDGIFNLSATVGADYRKTIHGMLSIEDINENALRELFNGYKKDWTDEKKRYFDTNEEIGYNDFLKAFKDYLPQDITESIRKTKTTSLQSLDLTSSIKIFKKYHEVREWIKKQLAVEFENHKLNDNELFTLANIDKLKFVWEGTSTELVGLVEILQQRKWLHLPVTSYREKAALILKTFDFKESERTLGGIMKVYKEYTEKTEPFESIQKNQ
jgi:hypothetical protein